ncbi:hypothetical protein ASPWEDRAFT_513891 [Aspergillus wentii DTO 134E9]|uniref:Uncharacterized protein n=1 Tax=Aspergillus wentii DTO 134E9 TaxID=1073089 RepID=A0A1L9RKR7_ASPWE|nr:uncharacterized protein ASPWEDRAFT_513891 [Aspergillus wentii DTO 134E9]OJJ35529.1 hypothetical protein ASPWEDRAFT_513891 [Aspergillus wentii DTO 134E9]
MAAATYYSTPDMVHTPHPQSPTNKTQSAWAQPTHKQDQLTDEIDEPSSDRGLGDAHTWRQIGKIAVKVAKALNDEDDDDDDSGSDNDSDSGSSSSDSDSDNEDEDEDEEQEHEEEGEEEKEEEHEEEKKEHHFAASLKFAGKLDKLAHKKEKEAKEGIEQQHQHQAQLQAQQQLQAHPQPCPQPHYTAYNPYAQAVQPQPHPHYTAYNPYSQGAQYQQVPRC